MITKHIEGKFRRSLRTRKKIRMSNRLRLSVYRSSRYLYAQLIDDATGKTIVAVNEKDIAGSSKSGITKSEKAKLLGNFFAEKAKKAKVTKIVFDRSGYKYHGRIKSFAEGIRESGLNF